jgi:hypothetical protein
LGSCVVLYRTEPTPSAVQGVDYEDKSGVVKGWERVGQGNVFHAWVDIPVYHRKDTAANFTVKLGVGSQGLELDRVAEVRVDVMPREWEDQGWKHEAKAVPDNEESETSAYPSWTRSSWFIGGVSAGAAAVVIGGAVLALVKVRRNRIIRDSDKAKDIGKKQAAAKRNKFFHRKRSSSIDSKRLEEVLPPLPPPPEICATAAIQSIVVDLEDTAAEGPGSGATQQTALKRFSESPQRNSPSPSRIPVNVPGSGRLELGVKISNQQFARPRQSSYVKSTMPVQISEEFKDEEDSDNDPGAA